MQGRIGAGRHERNDDRTNQRNGYRDRTLNTRLGSLQLVDRMRSTPKLHQGSYFPPFREARKTSEKALVAVIQEAWIGGVSTRRVEDLVQAMGLEGIGKSTVSKLCAEIDERVHAFLDRLRDKTPKLAAFIGASETDVLSYMDFPAQHRTKIHSTNPIERLNKEVKRRAEMVGIFPNEGSIIRLIGAVLLEQNDERQLQHRYMQVEAMADIRLPTVDANPTSVAALAH